MCVRIPTTQQPTGAVVAYAARVMCVRVPTTQLTTYKLLVSQPTLSSAQTHNNGCSGLRTTGQTGFTFSIRKPTGAIVAYAAQEMCVRVLTT